MCVTAQSLNEVAMRIHGIVLLALSLPVVEAVAVIPSSGSASGDDARKEKLPNVKHSKSAGFGYAKDSPLYTKEKVLKEWALAPKQVAPAAADATPVSNTMRCVGVLIIQFFSVYGVLFCVQTLKRMGHKLADEERSITHSAHSLFFTPMMCVAFLAARMRAVELARGQQPELHGLPPAMLQVSEVMCVSSNLVLCLLAWLGSYVYSADWDDAVRRARLDDSAGDRTGLYAMLLLRRAATLVLYCCFSVVCVISCVMKPPSALWDDEEVPKVSAALACTIFLSTVYFAVYLGLASSKLVNESGLLGPPARFSTGQQAFQRATTAVGSAPMLCCLFLAVRMRALQMDPVNGDPQLWVQACFYGCSGSIALQALVLLLASVFGVGKDVQTSGLDDRPVGGGALAGALEAVRLFLLAGLYTWTIAILVGLVRMRPDPASPTASDVETMPISILCIGSLAALFFGVNLMLWAGTWTPSDEAPESQTPLQSSLRAARESVSFCPMVSMAFACTMLRALQVSHGYGAPQEWSQWAMCICTTACALLTAVRMASQQPWAPPKLCTVLQYALLATIYVCVSIVLNAFLELSPKTAHGPGAITPKPVDDGDLLSGTGADGAGGDDMMQ